MSIVTSAQDHKDSIILKNGTTLSGLIKISKSEKKVTFRENKNSKKRKIFSKEIKQLIMFDEMEGRKKFYEYRTLGKNSKKAILLEVIVNGKLKYYYKKEYINSSYGLYGALNQGERFYVPNYYISKKDENFVKIIKVGTRFKKFRKISDYYFKDCPDVIAKIESGYFKSGDVEGVKKIVEYYNKNCTN